MKYWRKNLGDFDEMSDEYLDEHLEEGYLEDKIYNTEAPDADLGKYIEKIEDPEIKEKEIQSALDLYKKGNIKGTMDTLTVILMNLQNQLKLSIKNLNLCFSIDGFGVYNSVGSFTLKNGQPLLLYLELEGFSVKKDGNKYWINISEDIKIEDSNGKILFQKDNFITYNKYFMIPVIPFNLQNRVTSIPPGKYKYSLTIKDHNKNTSIFRDFEFEVK